MRTAAYCMREYGFCLSTLDPYNVAQYNVAPTSADYAQGLKYVSGAYHSITGGLAEMKSVLRSGYCFITGISVYSSFESDATQIRIADQQSPSGTVMYGPDASMPRAPIGRSVR